MRDNWNQGQQLTIPVARNHKMIEAGNAMMYRITRVKLNKRKTFPMTPQAREVALRAIDLRVIDICKNLS